MISKEDMDIARRMTSKYWGKKRFDQDDAFQSAIEGLLRKPSSSQGLRVLAMKNGVARAYSQDALTVGIPRASFDKLKKAGKLPEAWEIPNTDDFVLEEKQETDEGYETAEDNVLVGHMLNSLSDEDRRWIVEWMEKGVPVSALRGRRRDETERVLRELREVHG